MEKQTQSISALIERGDVTQDSVDMTEVGRGIFSYQRN